MKILVVVLFLIIQNSEDDQFYAINERVYFTTPAKVEQCLSPYRIVKKKMYTSEDSQEKYGDCFSGGITVVVTHPVVTEEQLSECLGNTYHEGDGQRKYVLDGQFVKRESINDLDPHTIKSIKEVGQLTSCEKYKRAGINGVIEIKMK